MYVRKRDFIIIATMLLSPLLHSGDSTVKKCCFDLKEAIQQYADPQNGREYDIVHKKATPLQWWRNITKFSVYGMAGSVVGIIPAGLVAEVTDSSILPHATLVFGVSMFALNLFARNGFEAAIEAQRQEKYQKEQALEKNF